MSKRVFRLFCIFLPLLLVAGSRCEIRGESPHLDANLSLHLQEWRTETTAPIREGNLSNVVLCAPDTDRKQVALTFDDSPDENNTFAILDILNRHGIKASFFMIASPMNDINATAVRRAHAEGHLILNHSFTHPRFASCDAERLTDEVRRAEEKIHSLIGKTPKLLRPPYGSLNRTVNDTLNALGYITVLWSLDSLDWALTDPGAIIENVTANIRPGDVILMHSSRSNGATVAALDRIIQNLSSQGYRFETLDRLLGIEAYR